MQLISPIKFYIIVINFNMNGQTIMIRSEIMSKHQKILIIIALLIAAFLAGFIFGFGYIAENPFEAFRLETWRTFFQQLRSF
ncbi:hypothetical protein CDO51_11440 [Natranaerobius trueperi]|uniref:DNA-directed RNA polymerase subunit beta n=2 Tax=Natranaerobius trueperi TaxID=759412 RepID=A0A226BXR0_9FIRM|nr:hypothetical protein CDO51_11440 [Natranaerobius trueperi]